MAGFNQKVNLSCTVSGGKGLSCSVSPTFLTLDGTNSATATLTINTLSTTPVGTYKITAKGTYGTLVYSTTFTLTLQ